MSTSRAISTISYNSEGFLKDKLLQLYYSKSKLNRILYYMYIKHRGEHDLSGVVEKDHFHVFVQPCSVDLFSLRDFFDEPCNGNLPLRCMPFEYSDLSNWLLYVLHDRNYLLSKGLIREFSYSLKDIYCSEGSDFLDNKLVEACGKIRKNDIALTFLKQGRSLTDLFEMGILNSRNAYMYNCLKKESFVPLHVKPAEISESPSLLDDSPFDGEDFSDIPF